MKKQIVLLITLLCVVSMSACHSTATIKDSAKEDLAKIEESVKQDVSEADEITKEKIDEALTYIHKNIDKIKENDRETAKKVYAYSTYLEEAAKKESTAFEHDIASFAMKSKSYAERVYTASEAEIQKLAEEGEAELKALGSAINE